QKGRGGEGELEGARPGLGPLRRFHAARSIPPANVWRPRRGDMIVERIEIESEPPVRGVLHPVGTRRADGLVLTHGAGGNAEGPLLVAVAEAFVSRGVAVLRCDLPFRQARPRGAPPPGGAEGDREGARAALRVLAERASGRLFLGGHSYGGRQASMLLAAEPTLASALLLQSYPLHPPGRATALRTAHLPQPPVPIL